MVLAFVQETLKPLHWSLECAFLSFFSRLFPVVNLAADNSFKEIDTSRLLQKSTSLIGTNYIMNTAQSTGRLSFQTVLAQNLGD